MKLINPADLADNSNEPKILKIADMDVWTRYELLDYIYSNDPTGGCIDFHLSTPTEVIRNVAKDLII